MRGKYIKDGDSMILPTTPSLSTSPASKAYVDSVSGGGGFVRSNFIRYSEKNY